MSESTRAGPIFLRAAGPRRPLDAPAAFLSPMPKPTRDAPITIAIRGDGSLAMTRAQRRSLIEQVHEVRRANAARYPMPDEGLIAVFRTPGTAEEDHVPRILNPPPPEQDEEPFRCDPPAPSPTPRRRGPGRPPKYAPEPEPVASPPPAPEATADPFDGASGEITFTFDPCDGARVLMAANPAMTVTPSDPEIAAIAAVHATLSGLDPAARRRVLAYVGARFPTE